MFFFVFINKRKKIKDGEEYYQISVKEKFVYQSMISLFKIQSTNYNNNNKIY